MQTIKSAIIKLNFQKYTFYDDHNSCNYYLLLGCSHQIRFQTQICFAACKFEIFFYLVGKGMYISIFEKRFKKSLLILCLRMNGYRNCINVNELATTFLHRLGLHQSKFTQRNSWSGRQTLISSRIKNKWKWLQLMDWSYTNWDM